MQEVVAANWVKLSMQLRRRRLQHIHHLSLNFKFWVERHVQIFFTHIKTSGVLGQQCYLLQLWCWLQIFQEESSSGTYFCMKLGLLQTIIIQLLYLVSSDAPEKRAVEVPNHSIIACQWCLCVSIVHHLMSHFSLDPPWQQPDRVRTQGSILAPSLLQNVCYVWGSCPHEMFGFFGKLPEWEFQRRLPIVDRICHQWCFSHPKGIKSCV